MDFGAKALALKPLLCSNQIPIFVENPAFQNPTLATLLLGQVHVEWTTHDRCVTMGQGKVRGKRLRLHNE